MTHTSRVVDMEALRTLVGSEIGVSDWLVVDQVRINAFADVTEDHQFIHVDAAAAARTPFGGTIAHGFLTLSLLSQMIYQCGVMVEGATTGVNYGFDRVRFISPVLAASRVRGRFVLKAVATPRTGHVLITYGATVEIEGAAKPALVADWLGLQITGAAAN